MTCRKCGACLGIFRWGHFQAPGTFRNFSTCISMWKRRSSIDRLVTICLSKKVSILYGGKDKIGICGRFLVFNGVSEDKRMSTTAYMIAELTDNKIESISITIREYYSE